MEITSQTYDLKQDQFCGCGLSQLLISPHPIKFDLGLFSYFEEQTR